MHIKAMLEKEGDRIWEKSGHMLNIRTGAFLCIFHGPFLKPLCLERAHGQAKTSVLAGTASVLRWNIQEFTGIFNSDACTKGAAWASVVDTRRKQ